MTTTLSAHVSMLFTEHPELDRPRVARDAGFTRIESWWPPAPDLDAWVAAVEEAGVERWLAARADPALERAYREQSARRRDFVALLRRHKDRLAEVFDGPGDDDAKRAGKRAVLASLMDEYARLKAAWGGFAGYDRFFERPPSNPQLAAVGAYNDLLPAFRALLAQEAGDLPRFYARVRELAALAKAERDERLRALGGDPR